MAYEALAGIPLYMRGQFVSGAGMHAPGGLTIGPTYGPGGPGGMVGPGGCPEVPGGHDVCVHPPMTETGPDRTPWQQREMSREEYDLQDSGCVPTSRHCGGSPRMPSRVWCCPGGGGGGIPGFVGYTFPGMGDVTVRQASVIGQLGLFQMVVWGALGIGVATLVSYLVKGATSNPGQMPLWSKQQERALRAPEGPRFIVKWRKRLARSSGGRFRFSPWETLNESPSLETALRDANGSHGRHPWKSEYAVFYKGKRISTFGRLLPKYRHLKG